MSCEGEAGPSAWVGRTPLGCLGYETPVFLEQKQARGQIIEILLTLKVPLSFLSFLNKLMWVIRGTLMVRRKSNSQQLRHLPNPTASSLGCLGSKQTRPGQAFAFDSSGIDPT